MLGARIAVLRRNFGWSQAELARRLKISASAVGMYEQGRREPSAELLVTLAREFEVSVDYLLTGQPEGQQERQRAEQALFSTLGQMEWHMRQRKALPFSRQEMIVLFAALLMES